VSEPTGVDVFLVGYIIEFSDGGLREGRILHRGTRKECEELVRVIPAVSYSGDRPVKCCYMAIIPAP